MELVAHTKEEQEECRKPDGIFHFKSNNTFMRYMQRTLQCSQLIAIPRRNYSKSNCEGVHCYYVAALLDSEWEIGIAAGVTIIGALMQLEVAHSSTTGPDWGV